MRNLSLGLIFNFAALFLTHQLFAGVCVTENGIQNCTLKVKQTNVHSNGRVEVMLENPSRPGEFVWFRVTDLAARDSLTTALTAIVNSRAVKVTISGVNSRDILSIGIENSKL